ncbi:hypothetical protein P152DRAFT_411307 [Eremomyces bilateralis CBS 781.70]|uniref:ER membrane protein complex subunit 2 n=1 Tax=Eremomyces bilateralis CBS 781.70 TaxID=1392243 RepID=A0A6G1GDM8_9PEZI|nr:uncharacterized protein P152DRAFT_411307 [Eremomyces bilateralis CBS 781.70]KAF1815969.1 hypothetical protein P152DRAFT_411307 [Eremomyces bilateralis CBS 781.70]
MSTELLNPSSSGRPETALRISQQAPDVLKRTAKTSLPFPLSVLFSSEKQETWVELENLLVACLRTGDDKSARLCLDRLTSRFGEQNERILALRGLYEEAIAQDGKAVNAILTTYYDNLLAEDPTNMPIRKRRIALLKSMSKTGDAIAGLVELLVTSPIDAESWAELADLYFSQNLFPQAIYCLEEVLLIVPNAWNMHARLGEVLFLSAESNSNARDAALKDLSNSLKRFCRSIELCDNYLRAFYGLKMVSSKLISLLEVETKTVSKDKTGELSVPDKATVESLNELATSKLVEILRKGSSGEHGWDGYEDAELVAIQALLDQTSQKVER